MSVRRVASLLAPLFLGFAAEAWAQRKFVLTAPKPPPPPKIEELRIFPGIQVPTDPDKFIWKTTVMGGEDPRNGIRVFTFDRGRRLTVGSLPPETQIKLTGIRTFGRTIYYSIPWDYRTGQPTSGEPSPGGAPVESAWVSGNNLYAAGLAAPGQ